MCMSWQSRIKTRKWLWQRGGAYEKCVRGQPPPPQAFPSCKFCGLAGGMNKDGALVQDTYCVAGWAALLGHCSLVLGHAVLYGGF